MPLTPTGTEAHVAETSKSHTKSGECMCERGIKVISAVQRK